jgi:Sugar phosphate isomerases/epimerases
VRNWKASIAIILKSIRHMLPPYVPGFDEHLAYATDIYKKCLRFCGEAGIPKLVIHGSSPALTDRTMSEAENQEMNIRLFKALAPEAKENGVMILLENLFTRMGKRHYIDGTCADRHEAVESIDTLNDFAGGEVFGLCLDTWHLNLCGKNQDTSI